MPRGDRAHIMKYPVVLPTHEILTSFASTVQPLTRMLRNNTNETIRLKELRNILLPKLISGQICVA